MAVLCLEGYEQKHVWTRAKGTATTCVQYTLQCKQPNHPRARNQSTGATTCNLQIFLPIHIFPLKCNHKSVCRSAGGPCRTRAERNDIYATSVQYSYCHVKVKEDLISILHKMEELRPHFYPTFVISCLQVRKIRPSICRSL